MLPGWWDSMFLHNRSSKEAKALISDVADIMGRLDLNQGPPSVIVRIRRKKFSKFTLK